ncbi:MAG: alpha/beta hydrolase, partial [Jatrophihabitantaceae bacterium]
YHTWSQLSSDLSGSYSSFAGAATVARRAGGIQTGRLQAVTLAGTRSGITRRALVYLPPQYFQPRYAHVRFPTIELIHGTPSSPAVWVVHLDIVKLADSLISRHLMGPTIIVMPTLSVGTNFEEGVDTPGALDDTYLTHDVRSDVLARYRASAAPSEWGIAGFSSGGYVAANLALRHPALFGASGIMDGYFRPQDGPAAAALHHDPAAEKANNPLLLAAALGRDASPLPAFWVSVGTDNAADVAGADAFTAALHGVEQVTLYREPGGAHNFYAWQTALPHLLGWMWTQLAAPALRVRFPISGPVRDVTLHLAPVIAAGRR